MGIERERLDELVEIGRDGKNVERFGKGGRDGTSWGLSERWRRGVFVVTWNLAFRFCYLFPSHEVFPSSYAGHKSPSFKRQSLSSFFIFNRWNHVQSRT